MVETKTRVEQRWVGQSVPRYDGWEKVTGKAEYAANISLPGMLHVKVARSTVPHGIIRHIDTAEAMKVPGVVTVITGQTFFDWGFYPYHGVALRDQPTLAVKKVLYVGDPVAAVVATTPEAAQEAADRIIVEYDELPAVFDPVEAAKENAPLLHEEMNPAGTYPDLKHLKPRRMTDNICNHYKLRHGNPDAVWSECAVVHEDVYTSAITSCVPMEPHAAVARVEPDGTISLWASVQAPSYCLSELSFMFRMPQNRFRIHVPYLGGGYGAKSYMKLEPLAVLAAIITKRPVKSAMDRNEEFLTITDHAARVRIKTGVDAEGRILATEVEGYYDTGAYAEVGPRLSSKAGYVATGPYRVPHAKVDMYCVYTNNPPAGARRGYGIPQISWAYEQQLDAVARRLGIDPARIRAINLLNEGEEAPNGTPWNATGGHEVLRAVTERIGWEEPFERVTPDGRLRGRGLGVAAKSLMAPTDTSADLILYGDGSVKLLHSGIEMGQGTSTALRQIAADELGIALDRIRIVPVDTDRSPYDQITAASRITFHVGNAVIAAARDLKARIAEAAAQLWGVDRASVRVADGLVWSEAREDEPVPLEGIVSAFLRNRAGQFTGHGYFGTETVKPDPETGRSPRVTPHFFVGACGVEVEVDPETGKVSVLRCVSAADVGKAINPLLVEQQITGSSIMQLGTTLMEEMHIDEGQLTNGTLSDYKVPTIIDIPPEMVPVIVEVPHPEGPYGAKGVGETSCMPLSAAVGNAIADALGGARVTAMPATPERVLRAWKQANGIAIEDEAADGGWRREVS